MNIHRISTSFNKRTSKFSTIALSLAVIGGFILSPLAASAAASSTQGYLHVFAQASSYSVGSLATVEVKENSGSIPINGVESDFSYPANQLKYVGYSVRHSAFNYPGPRPAYSHDEIQFAMLSTKPLTGDQVVVDFKFYVIKSGTANFNLASSAALLKPSGTVDPAINVNGSVKLTPSSGPVAPPIIPQSNTVPTATPAPTAATNVTVVNPATETSYAAVGSTTYVPTPNNSRTLLTAPVVVQPTVTSKAAGLNPVVRVEYYLDTKLVDTSYTSPFDYTVNTPKLVNGNYTLLTKTYYASGTSTSSTQTLDVSNPVTLTELKAAAQHYAFPSSLLLVLMVIVFVYLFIPKGTLYSLIRSGVNGAGVEPVDNEDSTDGTTLKPPIDIYAIKTPPQENPGKIYHPDPNRKDKRN